MPKFNKNKNHQFGREPFRKKNGYYDRYCCFCGFLIENQVLRKTLKCESCRRALPVREGPSKREISRCTDCDGFVLYNAFFCEICKTETECGKQYRIHQQELKRAKAIQNSNIQKALANNPKILEQLEIVIPDALKEKPNSTPMSTIDLTKSPFSSSTSTQNTPMQ